MPALKWQHSAGKQNGQQTVRQCGYTFFVYHDIYYSELILLSLSVIAFIVEFSSIIYTAYLLRVAGKLEPI